MEEVSTPAPKESARTPIGRTLSWIRSQYPALREIGKRIWAWLSQIKPTFCFTTVVVALLTIYGSCYLADLQSKNQEYLARLQSQQHEQSMAVQKLENQQLNQREMLRTALSMLSEKQEKNANGEPVVFDKGEQAVRKFAVDMLNRFCTEAGYEPITDSEALKAMVEGKTNIPGTWSGLGYSDYSGSASSFYHGSRGGASYIPSKTPSEGSDAVPQQEPK